MKLDGSPFLASPKGSVSNAAGHIWSGPYRPGSYLTRLRELKPLQGSPCTAANAMTRLYAVTIPVSRDGTEEITKHRCVNNRLVVLFCTYHQSMPAKSSCTCLNKPSLT